MNATLQQADRYKTLANLFRSKLNPKTGFIEAHQFRAFTSQQKETFLKLFRRYPNKTACAKAVGHNFWTVRHHLEHDPAFKEAFQELIEEICDAVEAAMIRFARRPQNFMDRISILRAYRPERWNPEYRLRIQAGRDPAITRTLAQAARNHLKSANQ